MNREIRYILPASAMRVGFLLGLMGGVVLGFVQVLLFRMVGATMSGLLPAAEAEQLTQMSGGTIVLLAIVTGLVFSVVGTIAGGLTAVFYNLAARWFGGIVVDVAGEEPAEESRLSRWEADGGEDERG